MRPVKRAPGWMPEGQTAFQEIHPPTEGMGEPIVAEKIYEISRGIWRVADVWADRIVWHDDDPTPQERLLAAALQQELRERVELLRRKPEGE